MRLLAALLLCAALAPAAKDEPPNSWFVIISGLGGLPRYDERFRNHADEAARLALRTAGAERFVRNLAGRAATRESIQATLLELAGEVREQDSFTLLLIGHGTFDGEHYKFNIPGPDVTARELREALDRIPSNRQLVVNTTSSSGAALEALASENRIVITATKSGRERTATVFAQYWIEALESAEADLDKNNVISAQEAFQYAERMVEEHFESQKKLATEHPRLEGGLAASFTLARLGDAREAAEDPALRPLLARREAITRQIDELKARKPDMPEEEYLNALQKLLLELAKVEQELSPSEPSVPRP